MSDHEVPAWPCPCCGYLVFGEPPGSYEVCPVCGWEDDLSQLRFAGQGGGANELSLIEAQQLFAQREGTLRDERAGRPAEPGYAREPGWRRLKPGADEIETPVRVLGGAGKDTAEL